MSNPGWECPKCGSVYAPWVKRCDECPQGRVQGANATGPVVVQQYGATSCGCPLDMPTGSVIHRSDCSLGGW